MTNIQYHTSTSIHILYNNTLPVFYQRKWWNNTNAITFGQIYSLLRNSVITFRIGAFVPSRTTLRRVDKQPTDPVRSASSVEYTDRSFLELKQPGKFNELISCPTVRTEIQSNKKKAVGFVRSVLQVVVSSVHLLINLWPRVFWYQVHVWSARCSDMVFVKVNPWFAQKYNNKATFKFRQPFTNRHVVYIPQQNDRDLGWRPFQDATSDSPSNRGRHSHYPSRGVWVQNQCYAWRWVQLDLVAPATVPSPPWRWHCTSTDSICQRLDT